MNGGNFAESRSSRFPTNDVITFDHRCHSHVHVSSAFRFTFSVHAYDSPMSSHEYLRALRDFGREGQRKIQFGSRLEFLMKNEVNAPCGNVARLPIVGKCFLTHGHTDNHRKG